MKERQENNMLSMKELSLKNTIRSSTVVTFVTCYLLYMCDNVYIRIIILTWGLFNIYECARRTHKLEVITKELRKLSNKI